MTTPNTFNLLFDLDDTLIHCNKYFDMVIEQFLEWMESWFRPHRLNKEEIKKTQQQFDLAGIQVAGFSADRFPMSFAETYDYYSNLCARKPDPRERQKIIELGYTVYDSEFELYPDVVETLVHLQEAGHKLSLFTGGVEPIQRSKVEKVNLLPFFENRIFVAQHKNSHALERILNSMAFDRATTWMIGNSLRTDIIPAIECGIGAVYIPPLSEWAFDQIEVPVKETDRFVRLQSIQQVPLAVNRPMLGR